jgi:hypothetical protein
MSSLGYTGSTGTVGYEPQVPELTGFLAGHRQVYTWRDEDATISVLPVLPSSPRARGSGLIAKANRNLLHSEKIGRQVFRLAANWPEPSKIGQSGGIRTPNLPISNRPLYPVELRPAMVG